MHIAAMMSVLPDDALAEVLRRLPGRSLAASRCVCKAWQAIVDDQQLLLPHLLPSSVRGLFVNYIDHDRPHLFARPTSMPGPRIDGDFDFIERDNRWDWYRVLDHCNGLVLRSGDHHSGDSMYVVNPATQRWTHLPRYCLAPVKTAPMKRWTWHALSSTTNRWKERVFLLDGEAAESVVGPLPPDKEFDKYDTQCRYAAYWKGALYVHCRGEFLSR